MGTIVMQKELIGLLAIEQDLLESIVKVAEEQQQALIKFDSDKITNIARRQESLSSQLKECEIQRFRLIAATFNMSIREAQGLTLSQLSDLLDTELFQEVVTLKQTLKGLVNKLQFLNSVNRILALRGRNSVRETLDFIKTEQLHVTNVTV